MTKLKVAYNTYQKTISVFNPSVREGIYSAYSEQMEPNNITDPLLPLKETLFQLKDITVVTLMLYLGLEDKYNSSRLTSFQGDFSRIWYPDVIIKIEDDQYSINGNYVS